MLKQEETVTVPLAFETSIGGYMGASYSLKLHGGKLIYEECGSGYEPLLNVEITPVAKEWGNFWRACDKAGMWSWEVSYANPNICDGTGWSVQIRLPDRDISTGGSNAFPGDEDCPEYEDYPPPFKKFLRAVRRLARGLPFE
jgi:hypothetical protein